ncbi:MAG: hypothetical protein ACREBW_07220 [Candidatus Micrarchaeaceae archaeon]
MKRPILDKTFWRFLLGFVVILVAAFLVLLITSQVGALSPAA